MTLTQLKTLLNLTLANSGRESGSLTDLSTWQDYGTAIASMSASDYESFLNKFSLGVIRTEFDTRVWERSLDIMTDTQTYEGIKQYVKASPLTADDVTMIGLVNGTDYNDRVYKDLTTDVLLVTKDWGFQFSWCVPQMELTTLFSSEDSAMSYVSLINATVASSFNRAKWNVQLSLLAGLALSAYSAGRKIQLVTSWNATHTTQLTTATAMESDEFKRYCREIITNLRNYMTDMTMKFNDGTVETFSPMEDTRLTLLTQFATALTNISTFNDISNNALALPNVSNVNMWQRSGATDMLYPLSKAGAISDSATGDSASNVVGLIYDKYACGMTIKAEKVTSDYVPKGDFTKFFGSFVGQNFINTRNNSVVLTLD